MGIKMENMENKYSQFLQMSNGYHRDLFHHKDLMKQVSSH